MSCVVALSSYFLGIEKINAKTKLVASLYFVMTSLTSVGFGNIAANTKSEQESVCV